MKPKNIKINFDLTLNVNRDSNLYHAIRDTSIEDCGALLREYWVFWSFRSSILVLFDHFFWISRIDDRNARIDDRLKPD